MVPIKLCIQTIIITDSSKLPSVVLHYEIRVAIRGYRHACPHRVGDQLFLLHSLCVCCTQGSQEIRTDQIELSSQTNCALSLRYREYMRIYNHEVVSLVAHQTMENTYTLILDQIRSRIRHTSTEVAHLKSLDAFPCFVYHIDDLIRYSESCQIHLLPIGYSTTHEGDLSPHQRSSVMREEVTLSDEHRCIGITTWLTCSLCLILAPIKIESPCSRFIKL
jgi:hypothetical protein